MKLNYNIEQYEYKNRYRNLTQEAKGVVKSQKFFPVFLNDGKEEIFKPLSKTKPLVTPFFAYSEVFWSTVINTYFDSITPIYRLAICNGYDEVVQKFNNHGTIVPSILKKGETLVNLLEYFKENKDPNVDIDKYVNYCMMLYDYTPIFNSDIFRNNTQLGRQLALQVLISILKADQNYHYENVSFIFEDGKPIKLAPPIDHEFSTMFLYIDNLDTNEQIFKNYKLQISSGDKGTIEERISYLLLKPASKVIKNLDLIVERYEDVVINFLNSLELFIHDLENNPFSFEDNGYLYPFNSNNYLADEQLYKKNDIETAAKISSMLIQYDINISDASKVIYIEILTMAKELQKNLIQRLEAKHKKELVLRLN